MPTFASVITIIEDCIGSDGIEELNSYARQIGKMNPQLTVSQAIASLANDNAVDAEQLQNRAWAMKALIGAISQPEQSEGKAL